MHNCWGCRSPENTAACFHRRPATGGPDRAPQQTALHQGSLPPQHPPLSCLTASSSAASCCCASSSAPAAAACADTAAASAAASASPCCPSWACSALRCASASLLVRSASLTAVWAAAGQAESGR